jgi:hypothetical protein
MPNERPLCDAEHARLAQIRQNAAIRNARNRIELENEKDSVESCRSNSCSPAAFLATLGMAPTGLVNADCGWLDYGGFLDRRPSRDHGDRGCVPTWDRPRGLTLNWQ